MLKPMPCATESFPPLPALFFFSAMSICVCGCINFAKLLMQFNNVP